MTAGRRTLLLVVAGVTLWYVGILVFWAAQPLRDAVPAGVDYTLAAPRKVSVNVECNTVFATAAHDGSPLPTLAPQPATAPPLGFQRDVCSDVHSQAQTLFYFDTGLVALVWIGAVWLWGRARRSTVRDHPLAYAST